MKSSSLSGRGKMPKPLIIILIVLGFTPLFLQGEPYLTHLAVSFAIYCTLATNLNLIIGYAGQMSFAHAAFYGIGAYTSSLLALKLGLNFWIRFPVAFLLVTLIAFCVGVPTLRLRGTYLAIATMGLQFIVQTILLKWISLTNGPMGLTGIPSPSIFGLVLKNSSQYFYLAYLWFLLNVIILWRIEASRAGFEMLAIREDEEAALASGIDAASLKLWAFSLAAGLAGGTGAIYAHYIGSIDPSPFRIDFSSAVLVMVILGGRGTIIGGAIGALVLSIIPEWLRFLSHYRMMVYGFAMILLIMYMPEGILGWINRRYERWQIPGTGVKRNASTRD